MEKVTYSREYWIDNNHNRWSCDKYTKEEAIKLSGGLENCYYCTNCNNCSDCDNCVDCSDCSDCDNCDNCVDCVDCVDCDNCDYS